MLLEQITVGLINDRFELWANKYDGQMRSETREVYGLQFDVSRADCPERRMPSNMRSKNKENNPVRGLVSDRLQSWHKLSATAVCPIGRLEKDGPVLLYDFELYGDIWGVFADQFKVRLHVPKEGLCALVHSRRNVVGIVFWSEGGHSDAVERLWGSRKSNSRSWRRFPSKWQVMIE